MQAGCALATGCALAKSALGRINLEEPATATGDDFGVQWTGKAS
jgi:hypothetical protein